MNNLGISFQKLNRLVKAALREDIGTGDVTSAAIIPSSFLGQAEIVAKGRGVLCGMEILSRVFLLVDRTLRIKSLARDGDQIRPGSRIALIRGRLRSILAGERVALNFLGHLSGVATLTRSFVSAVKPFGASVYDTRKTLPLLRALEKYAVRVGGGVNHRFGLHDMILIKDNHIDAVGDLAQAIQRARVHNPKRLAIACEARNLSEVKLALEGRADLILLDNMSAQMVKKALALSERSADPDSPRAAGLSGRPLASLPGQTGPQIEVSGGIDVPHKATQLARLGVRRISVGRITHSAPALDFSLDVTPPRAGSLT